MDNDFITPEYCSNCGTKTTAEICPNCRASTGITYKDLSLKYPYQECREANIPFFKIILISVLALPFTFIAFEFVISYDTDFGINVSYFLFLLLLLSPALIAIGMLITSVSNNIKVKKYGTDTEAIVYGYEDDGSLQVMGMCAQTVKLIINTPTGEKMIFYDLGKLTKPYDVNSKVKIRVYNDIFLIKGKL